MSLLGSRLAFTHRCSIESNASTTTDDWGTPAPPDYSNVQENVLCRLQSVAGRETAGPETFVVVEDLRLRLPVDTAVTEADRIGDITDRGTVILAGPTSVRSVLRHKDHLELLLVRIT